jgi:hypothetical protein
VWLAMRQVSPIRKAVLNIGSGARKMEGAVNVDLVSWTAPDVVHDLNQLPWPFADDTFEEVHAYDVIEHLDNVVVVMEEVHRVSVNGAAVHVTVPHFSSSNAFTDPTHKHYFSVMSMNYFLEGHKFAFYSNRRFRVRHASIVFQPTLINKLVRRAARRWPAEYERRWAWMFPAWFISFELQVIKLPSSVNE